MGRWATLAISVPLLFSACGFVAPLDEVEDPRIVPIPLACNLRAYVAEGDEPWIDDFEDGDSAFIRADGRAGTWEDWSPRDEDGEQTNGKITFHIEPIPEAFSRPGSRYAAHLTASDMVYNPKERNVESPYAGFGGRLLGHKLSCYDASNYTGIGFWARGKGQMVSAQLATEATLPVTGEGGIPGLDEGENGDCVPNFELLYAKCYDHFQYMFEVHDEWTYHRVSWKQLMQQAWGQESTFVLNELVQISFDLVDPHKQKMNDVWIDDVRFLQKESRCAGAHVEALGGFPVIDDFESADDKFRLPEADFRSGHWEHDAEGAKDPVVLESVRGGATGQSRRSLRVAGENSSKSGGGVIAHLVPGCYNIITVLQNRIEGIPQIVPIYEGLSFWARSGERRVGEPLHVRAALATADTASDCPYELDSEVCHTGFGKVFELSAEWKLYSLTWDEVSQIPDGDKRPLNLDRVVGLRFSVPGSDEGEFEFFLDDVRFLEGPLPGTGQHDGRIGSACPGAWACVAGLSCVGPDGREFGGAGAAGGLCTTECRAHSDCVPFGSDVACAAIPGATDKYCLQTCALGIRESSKCHAREELACASQRDETCSLNDDCQQGTCVEGWCRIDVCLPNCNIDGDCGEDLFCHTARGVCKEDPPEEGHNGSLDCSGCRGECITLGEGEALLELCADRCTTRAENACGHARDPGVCSLVDADSARSESLVRGDLGWCAAPCSCEQKCPNGAFTCIAIDEETGYCGLEGEPLLCE